MVQSPVQQTTVTDALVKVVTELRIAFGLIGNGNVDFISALTVAGFLLPRCATKSWR